MAKFRYKHIQSTVEDKVPSNLLDGEIAVNRFKGKEKLFLKNASGDVVSFSTDAQIDVKIGEKASQTDLTTLSGTVTGHTADSTIHVTSADKTAWNAKLDSSDVEDFFDDAKYEDSGTSKVINFYHGSTIKATINADDFIKDGMISGVTLESKSGTTYLVIEWNTDAGTQTTELNIGDIFEADNYYTTAQTSGATELSTAFAGKADTATTLAGYGITDAYTKSETSGATEISNALADKSDTGHTHLLSDVTDVTAPLAGINSITGAVGTMAFENASFYSSATEVNNAFTAINNKVGTGFTSSSITDVILENEEIVTTAINDLNTNKLDATAYTPTDLSNYYQKSETSGATEISNALGGKVNSATFTGHTADTAAHFTSGEKTAWNSFSASTEASINDLSGQSETIAAALVNLNETLVDLNETFTAHTADTSVHMSQSLLDEIDTLKKAIYSENGHEYIEIGGVKWATMNIGASSITDYGQYFQWGSTTGFLSGDVGSNSTELKKPFSWADYKFGNGTSSPDASGMTKYNSGDTKTVLDLSDDAAHANWGGSWRMPTNEEFAALRDAVNTGWTDDYQGSGVSGLVCTDKTDSSKVLFFPAAAACSNGSVGNVGSYGSYWSSTLDSPKRYACGLDFFNTGAYWQDHNGRFYGFPVRGVVG